MGVSCARTYPHKKGARPCRVEGLTLFLCADAILIDQDQAIHMPKSGTTNEKSVLAGLLLFGILAIVLGFLNFKRMISAMGGASRVVTNAPIAMTPEEFESQQRRIQAAQDTDGDGLSDLDELERYHTSPYLADTDSDGKSDKAEIDAGEDPNCPKGQACAQVRVEAAPDFRLTPAIPKPVTDVGSAPLTPADLRAALMKQGISKELLDGMTDEQLTAAYNKTAQSFSTNSMGGASLFAAPLTNLFTNALQSGPNSGAMNPQQALDALSRDPVQIRKILEQQGIPKAQLDQLDDATLLKVWDEAVAKTKAGNIAPTP